MGKMNFFKKEDASKAKVESLEKWKVLIADDEPDIHTLTKTVLNNFTYNGKKLEFLSAYSGAETISILEENKDVVLVLLDVIMETDNAGLVVTKKIRNELRNKYIQIVLRTGQAADVPEAEVVKNYEINDYKEKTELTADKLITTLTTAIRSYENIKALEKSKDEINELNYELTELLASFDENVIASKTDIYGRITYVSKAFCKISGYTQEELLKANQNIISSGNTSADVYKQLWKTITSGKTWRGELEDKNKNGATYWLYSIITPKYDSKGNFLNYTAISHDITSKKSIEYANKKIEHLNKEIEDTQKEVVFRVGAIAETRSKETGLHVKRVAKYSKLFALYYGLNEREAELLKQASPMHDIGKIGIPDSILNKEGKLTEEEFEIMKTHAQLGYDMLKGSNKSILKVASIVAYEHQEKYDGTGYPSGLKGEDIHIYGRITAIADVFDALGSRRCYKEPWEDERIFEFFKEQKGKHFDPKLVDIFFENLDEFLKIRDKFKD